MERKDLLHNTNWNVNECSHYGKYHRSIPKKPKKKEKVNQIIFPLSVKAKGMRLVYQRHICNHMSTAAFMHNTHGFVSVEVKKMRHIKLILIRSFKWRRNHSICDNKHIIGELCIEWRTNICNFTHVLSLKFFWYMKSIKIDNRGYRSGE